MSESEVTVADRLRIVPEFKPEEYDRVRELLFGKLERRLARWDVQDVELDGVAAVLDGDGDVVALRAARGERREQEHRRQRPQAVAEEADEAGPVAAEGHGEGVLDEDEAVALGEGVEGLRVVGFEGEFAEEVEFVGLAEVFAGEVDDAGAEGGELLLEGAEVGAELGFGELVEGFLCGGGGGGR